MPKLSQLTQGTVPEFYYAIEGAGSRKYRSDAVLNVRNFGAVGNGTTDDRLAVQNCFDVAYGTMGSPHGITDLKYTNKAVYFPAGNYKIGSPLYLPNVEGGRIFGDGADISILTYGGTGTEGNTIPQGNLDATGIANVHAITPLIMTQGFAYSSISNLGLHGGGKEKNVVCFYLFWNGQGGAGPTLNTYTNVYAHNCGVGFLIGYNGGSLPNPGLCSEQLFLNCHVLHSSLYGFRNINPNALNNAFINCGSSNGDGNAFSVPTGSVYIYHASLAAHGGYDITTGQSPITIVGARTENANFIDATATQTQIHLTSCFQDNSVSGVGDFIKCGDSTIMMDACLTVNTGANTGMINAGVGSGAAIFLRGCQFRNPGFLNNFNGIVQYDSGRSGFTTTNQFGAVKKAGAFVAADVRDGTWIVGRDTVGGTTKLYYNNGGVLQSVTLA